MKKQFLIIMALVLTIGAVSAFNTVDPVIASELKERVISVSAEAEIKVEPDKAYIDIGVTTEAKDSKQAQSENDRKMAKITEQLLELGIDAKNIKTSGYSLYPKYNYNQASGESTIVGYVARNTLTVDVLDIDKVGVVIDKVVEDGANVINGIGFDISNREELYNKALAEAVSKTKTKALVMAEVFGAKTVNPKEISEQSSYYAPAMYRSMSAGMMNDAMAESSASISTGELTIKASVHSTFTY